MAARLAGADPVWVELAPGASGVVPGAGSGGAASMGVDELLRRAVDAAGDPGAGLALLDDLGDVPLPGHGRTAELWSLLVSLAAVDLTVARAVEPHLDALAILDQAGAGDCAGPGQSWGVYAAHAPGVRLEAVADDTGAWTLTGTKPWCSLAQHLTHAVVTAHTSPTARRAFAVDLRHPGVTHDDPTGWVSRGLPELTSVATHYDAVPAQPVGGDEWYLERPGFAWGGMGVAACWYGGAVGMARTLAATAGRRAPDQVALMHVGAVDTGLHAARAVLAEAAAAVDAGNADGAAGALLAARVRGVVASVAEDVATRVGHALGPGPLTSDAAHAARTADLQVYLRQHHAERDEAALGAQVLAAGSDRP
ncbi:acyl-CoA dehydrogenase [Pedococcus sp. 2YAF34]|uniref:acyl-CoA dehydrogenase n=1 Tax=Pedococcus sp. 2YAF34 TaxID=3233032 RepID=UPI003F954AE8